MVGIDDSRPLRELAMKKYGLTEAQVTTQAGKSEIIMIEGVPTEIRVALGGLGKLYEEAYGSNHWVELAIKKFVTDANPRQTSPISFGSIRMSQGHAVKAAGGMIIAVNNSRIAPSHHDFDQFDHDAVDVWINNNSSLEDLRLAVIEATSEYLANA